MIDSDRYSDPAPHARDGTATPPGWRLDIKAAVIVAAALLIVVLALSLMGYGSDDVRPGREVAPVTEMDAERVSGVQVGGR